MAQRIVLRRILGTPTALCISLGVAVGSGIFRTPGDIAGLLGDPRLIVLAWIVGGFIILLQGMVTAELATRFPRAGGEYVFLREAYGDFVAFFFGWAYTVFVIGAGCAPIALAFGDFACELFGWPGSRCGYIAAAAIVSITGINVIGLRAGAGVQNALTLLKAASLAVVAALGLIYGRSDFASAATAADATTTTAGMFLAALLPVLWSYDGTTDSVKMAEEIRDVRRALPRAVIGATLSLTVLYALFNVSLLRVAPASELAGVASAPGEAMRRLFGESGRLTMLVVAMLVCLGSLSSTIPATIRVTFALARDGLAFSFLARMSRSQSPVPALLSVSCISIAFVLNRSFSAVLDIYFFASAVLFALTYGSLLLFRMKEKEFPAHAFRCPMGRVVAAVLILFQAALAGSIAYRQPRDALYTLGLLVFLGALYLLWKRPKRKGEDVPRMEIV